MFCFPVTIGKVEFFEEATKGQFVYQHSDGEERYITLNPRWLQTFDYGKKTFRGYICHEDHPYPLPEEPTVTAEMTGIAVEKTLNDVKKWKTKELSEKTKMWQTIFFGIAMIIAAAALYRTLVPANPEVIVRTVETVAETTVKTITANGTLI